MFSKVIIHVLTRIKSMIHKQMMNNNIFFFCSSQLFINKQLYHRIVGAKKKRIEHNKLINLNVIDVCRPFWANQSHMNHMNFQCNRSTSALRTVWRLNCGRELPHQPHDKLAKNAQIKQMNDLLHFNTYYLSWIALFDCNDCDFGVRQTANIRYHNEQYMAIPFIW